MAIILFSIILTITKNKNNYVILFKSIITMILLCILLYIINWEYNNLKHLLITWERYEAIDSNIIPKGETIDSYEERYREYEKQHPEYDFAKTHNTWEKILIFRIIFYTYLVFVFLPINSFVSKGWGSNK